MKPSNVPDGATWDPSDNEWVLGSRNADGELVGLVHYYRPDGTLCCNTNFVEGTPHGPFQRHHNNAEVSRTGDFVQGVLHGTNRFVRCAQATSETFPAGLPDAIWRCEMDYQHGNVAESRIYDRHGRRVMEDGQPFPEQRPPNVPAAAHFRKHRCRFTETHEYRWITGASRVDEDNNPVRLGTWQTWNQDGLPVTQEPYDDDGDLHGLLRIYDEDNGEPVHALQFEHGQRVYARPEGVDPSATFDEDEELWTEHIGGAEGPANGPQRSWDGQGRLRCVETYVAGEVTRVQEVLEDGSWAQDSTYLKQGIPQCKRFRRTDDSALDSFPNVGDEHPTARHVEYAFDAHGMMTGFCITDANNRELERENLYRDASGAIEQRRFDSIEAASQAWVQHGDHYTSTLNRWLGELYGTGEPTFEEPSFDDDLERATISAVETMNAAGQGQQVRQLFPRYYDGIGRAFWHKYGLVVDSVLHGGNTLYARVQPPDGTPYIVGIKDGAITKIDHALAMGSSHDKAYFAWAYEDTISVIGSSGTTNFAYPQRYDHSAADALGTKSLGSGARMQVRDIRVMPGGKEVLCITAEGIFLLAHSGARRLYPLDSDMDTYVEHYEGEAGEFDLEMDFPNADVAPNGALITCGGMFRRGNMAGLAIWSYERGDLRLKNTSQEDAFFPMQATFHRERPHVAFAATLYASLSNALTNTTFRLDLAQLEDGDIDGFGGGIAQERGVVNVIRSFGNGFLLGYDTGYVRWMGLDENVQLLGYLFVGGSIRHLDVSPDQQGFVVATDSGLVAAYQLAPKASRHLVTTMPVEDASCAVFLRSFEPMLW